MNDFEIAKNVRSAVLRKAGEVMAYSKSWGAKFCVDEMTSLPVTLVERSEWFKPINANKLTAQELGELGFGTWSDELPIRLIPVWIIPFLQDQIEAQCIDGKRATSVKQMDNDHRFGCIAYGVIPKDVEVQP